MFNCPRFDHWGAFQLAVCFYNMLLSFFEYFLLSGTTKCSRLELFFLNSRVSHFSRRSWFFLVENSPLKREIYDLDEFFCLDLFSAKNKGLWSQFSLVTQLCLTLCNPTDCSVPGFPVHNQLQELTQTHVHWVSDAIQPSHPLLSPSPPASVFSSESVLHIRWPKYASFSFSISPSNEYSGQISFRMDCLDLLAVQGTLKSFLQHYSLKASILRRSAFFMVQLSHPYMTTGKTIALTRWTFLGKVMSLLSNMLSRLIMAFLPRMV